MLVKLAYRGLPSRAEFPLTPDFATNSNNSTVGLSGQGRVIEDVDEYVAGGGAYYTCDGDVQSEACLPLFSAHPAPSPSPSPSPAHLTTPAVIGIIDAESTHKKFFSGQILSFTIAFALAAQHIVAGL